MGHLPWRGGTRLDAGRSAKGRNGRPLPPVAPGLQGCINHATPITTAPRGERRPDARQSSRRWERIPAGRMSGGGRDADERRGFAPSGLVQARGRSGNRGCSRAWDPSGNGGSMCRGRGSNPRGGNPHGILTPMTQKETSPRRRRGTEAKPVGVVACIRSEIIFSKGCLAVRTQTKKGFLSVSVPRWWKSSFPSGSSGGSDAARCDALLRNASTARLFTRAVLPRVSTRFRSVRERLRKGLSHENTHVRDNKQRCKSK